MRWLVGSLVMMCACTGRGVVGTDDGADTGEDESSDSVGSMTSVGSFDDDSADDADDDAVDDDSADTAMDDGLEPQDQQWLLAMATFLDPVHPLQWHVIVDYEDGVLIELRLQSLSLDMGSTTTPRLPVGDVTIADQLAVDDVGNFDLVIPELFVPGQANPITGSDIVAQNVRLSGMGTVGTSCGTVEGDVITPISTSLTGSTFAATPIASVGELPLEFPVACE